jgi:biopolymer transport protein ExbD
MKIRHSTGSGGDKVELQMTPMIDIVFQLLVFFIMTFKIVSQEGDFNIKMPLAAPSEGLPEDNPLPPMKVRLRADADGNVNSIMLNEKAFTDWRSLNNYMIGIIGNERGPGSRQETAEVELDCDYNLRYENVVNAVTAVSGFVGDDGEIVKLVEKIKFAPPRNPAGAAGG